MVAHILGFQKAYNVKIGKFVTTVLFLYIRFLFEIVNISTICNGNIIYQDNTIVTNLPIFTL